MNVWLKTANSRRTARSASLLSDISMRTPLPVIQESARHQQAISESLFSDDDNSSELDFCEFQRYPARQNELIGGQSVRPRPQTVRTWGIKDEADSQSGRFYSIGSSREKETKFSLNSSAVSRSSLEKRQLIQDSDPKREQSSNSFRSIVPDSYRRPSQRPTRESAHTNSKRVLTTGRKKDAREHIISIIQYCSNEVGVACYNISTGQITLTQIIERMTYFRTVSTVERFYPQEIVYSVTLENTPLIRKLMQHFKCTSFRPIKRNLFDETKGFYIYALRGNKGEHNPDNKFLSFAALNALVSFLESSFELTFAYSALNIKWHFLEEVLVIHSQTIADLEIFINSETKTCTNTFIENFTCLTDGGTRLLRANFLQPLTDLKAIRLRQDLAEMLIQNKPLYDLLARELVKFKHYEPITAKFIQKPKKGNLKSIKSYLGAILSLSRLCFELQHLRNRLSMHEAASTILQTLMAKLSDPKLEAIRRTVRQNFDQEILKTFENEKARNRRENFIFLFKVQNIEDEFAEISRLTYSHTVEDILKMFAEIKQKANEPSLRLLHNDFKGYYLSAKSAVDLNRISQALEDDILNISARGPSVTFTTSMLASMNNRLKENENKLLSQSEGLLLAIIEQIQSNSEILFEVNYCMSMVDMVMSFSSFVKHYRLNFRVSFCRPVLARSNENVVIENLRTVWTMEKFSRLSQDTSLQLTEQNKALVIHKDVNSFQQLNVLYSFGLLAILGQIGCLVPASRYEGLLYDTLISKMKVGSSLENKMSHFQMEMSNLGSILENSACNKNDRCLILIDEVVKGTQPEEEYALSIATVEELLGRLGKSIILISDSNLFSMLSRLKNTASYTPAQTSKSNPPGASPAAAAQTRINECFAKYNFSAHFINIYNSMCE